MSDAYLAMTGTMRSGDHATRSADDQCRMVSVPPNPTPFVLTRWYLPGDAED